MKKQIKLEILYKQHIFNYIYIYYLIEFLNL